MDWQGIAFTASVWVLPVLIAITFHEAAHGWVAWRLGDDTAYRLGRVTFNPFRHIDLFGTILLPGMLLFFVAFVVSMGVVFFGPGGAGQGYQQGKGQRGLFETCFGFHKKFPNFL